MENPLQYVCVCVCGGGRRGQEVWGMGHGRMGEWDGGRVGGEVSGMGEI